MPTVLRKQWFCLTGRFRRKGTVRTLSLSSAMSRPIVATLTGASPRLSQKPDKAGLISLIIPAPAFCHPIEGLSNDNRCADIAPFSRLSYK